MRGARHRVAVVALSFLLAVSISASIRPLSAYAPQKGDYFHYSETITVNNGQGSYTGYSDQTLVTGMEQMNSVSAGLVSASFNSSYRYSNNSGNSSSSSSEGQFTWSSGNFTYVEGTDNQVGYSKPIYVWFAMNPSLPVGSTFHALNTMFTVLSKNYSLQLPAEGNKYVETIQTQGTGVYTRNDSYGVFTATYTWNEYFDPTTGYIVGYAYVELDTGEYQGVAGGFTYTDDLYVSSTSYALASSSPSITTTSSGTLGSTPYVTYALLAVAVLVIAGVVVYAATRRRGKGESIPKHPQYTPPPPPPPPSPSQPPSQSVIDLGSRPGEQVVIREVAKVNCSYCGTLIPTTAETCPYCGAPRK